MKLLIIAPLALAILAAATAGDPKCNAVKNAKEQYYCKRNIGCGKHGAGWHCVVKAEAETCSICGPRANEKCTGICAGDTNCDRQTNAKVRLYCNRDVGCHSHGAEWHCAANAEATTCSICGPGGNEKCIGICSGGPKCNAQINAKEQHYCKRDIGCKKHGAEWHCQVYPDAEICSICGPGANEKCTGICSGGSKCDAEKNAKDQHYCKRAIGCHSHGAGWHCVVNQAAETCSICGPALNEKCIGFCAQGVIPTIKDCDEKLQDEVFCVDTKGCQSYDPDWKCVMDDQAHCNHHCGMDTHQICQGFCK